MGGVRVDATGGLPKIASLVKNFLLGVLATAIGGFLLLLLSTGYSDWRASGASVLQVEMDDHLVTMGDEELETAKALRSGHKAMMVSVTNTGSERLENLTFLISPKLPTTPANIVGFGVAADVGETAVAPEMTQQGEQILVRFEFLEPGQGKVLWVVHNGPQALEVISRTPGLRIDDISYEIEDNFLFYVLIAFACLGCLIIGIVIGDRVNNAMLRKIGLDPKEVQELYIKSSNAKSKEDG